MGSWPTPKSGGWLLVGLIVLISAVILALVGITFYLTEHLRTTSLRQNQTKAIYLAQAGAMQAIYDFRFNTGGNAFTPGTYDAVPGDAGQAGLADDDVFILEGVQADFLLANMIPSILDQKKTFGLNNRDQLRNWRLRNVRADTAILITHLTVNWDPDTPATGEGVARVEINGNKVWPTTAANTSFASRNTELDITDVSIPAATERTGNTIYFATGGNNSPMPGKTFIELKFRMSDDSTRFVRYTSAPEARSGSLTVVSVGEARQGQFPFIVRRRLQVEYRLNEANSTDLQQIGNITSDEGLLLTPAVSPTDQRPGYRELN